MPSSLRTLVNLTKHLASQSNASVRNAQRTVSIVDNLASTPRELIEDCYTMTSRRSCRRYARKPPQKARLVLLPHVLVRGSTLTDRQRSTRPGYTRQDGQSSLTIKPRPSRLRGAMSRTNAYLGSPRMAACLLPEGARSRGSSVRIVSRFLTACQREFSEQSIDLADPTVPKASRELPAQALSCDPERTELLPVEL